MKCFNILKSSLESMIELEIEAKSHVYFGKVQN